MIADAYQVPIHSGDPPRQNKREAAVYGFLRSRGCLIYRSGWPDFLVTPRNGATFCVEVKSKADRVSHPQILMHGSLVQAGIAVEIVYPDLESAQWQQPLLDRIWRGT